MRRETWRVLADAIKLLEMLGLLGSDDPEILRMRDQCTRELALLVVPISPDTELEKMDAFDRTAFKLGAAIVGEQPNVAIKSMAAIVRSMCERFDVSFDSFFQLVAADVKEPARG